MNIPAVPTTSGHVITGKVSWFGGPNDGETAGNRTASGAPTSTPGIAIYNRATLGGYWRVTDTKTGRSAVLKQTDLGPAPWTGRKIDVTYSALNRFGYGEHNFPTDSTFKAEYLGRSPATTAAPRRAALPSGAAGASPGAPKTAALPGMSFDRAAFKTAQRRALVGQLMASEGGTKNNPLFATGLLSTKAPNPADFMSAATTAPTGRQPAQQRAAAVPAHLGAIHGAGAAAVSWANQHIGKDAESLGSNLGPELNILESHFGMRGEPWCAMFATTAAARGGASKAVRSASVAQIRQWAGEGTHGYMYGLLPSQEARPGDLMLFGDQHVALVKAVGPQGITTIEGNANGSGGVVELHHSFSEGQIARPNYHGRRG